MYYRYQLVWDIIDQRWQRQFHSHLHAAAYYLNLHYHYSDDFNPDVDIKLGLYSCLFRMIDDTKERAKIDLRFESFKDAKGLFGIDFAISARRSRTPGF